MFIVGFTTVPPKTRRILLKGRFISPTPDIFEFVRVFWFMLTIPSPFTSTVVLKISALPSNVKWVF